MGKGPETLLVGHIIEAVKDVYPLSWIEKIHGGPYQSAGIPDLLIVIDGRMFALEVKAQKQGESREAMFNRTTPRQYAQIEALRRAGAVAEVVDSVGSALNVIEEYLSTKDLTI